MPRRENANTPASAQAQQDAVSEGIENFELPRALVTRIAKSAVRGRFSYRYGGAFL
jgi:DNA polymerase epsilon subunit 3